ncbi:MAG: hypothetical protein O2892_02525 [Actinomycetota bacterium]|nr:hypothetical protein [Actinomycetota bacterium]MDA2947900.1 hypothetical protein [Actinomycetota bacterium]
MTADDPEAATRNDVGADVDDDLDVDVDTDLDFDTEVETDIEADDAEQTVAVASHPPAGPRDWRRLVAFAVLPGLALLLAVGAVWLGWKNASQRGVDVARTESVSAARDATIAMLSYRADTAERDLTAALDRITGPFRDSYTDLVQNTVIPAAKEKKISAQARVPAAASALADRQRAVVLVFVNQTVTVGGGAPTETLSSVKVTLEKVGERWLVSGFDPV